MHWLQYLLSRVKQLYAAGGTLTEESAKLIVDRCDFLPNVFSLHDIHQRNWIRLKNNEVNNQRYDYLFYTTSSNFTSKSVIICI